jgi:uncharacterized membrane protein SpoIIM required for sporulation
MDLKSFIKKHRSDWNRLEQSLNLVTKRKRKTFTPDQLNEFQLLYQKASHHLSYSQTHFPNEEITSYLNELVGKGHNALYGDQITSLFQIRKFFGQTFIRLLTEQWKMVLLAMSLFTLGAIGGYVSVMQDPLHLYSILPAEISHAVDPERLGEGHDQINSPIISTHIMTNNIQVALIAFAGGVTLGLFTGYILIHNGIMLGALAALFWQHDKFYDFWAYIVPHGIIELAAIFIAGGAGLLMGYKVLVPGATPRLLQLKQQALRSVQLLLGTVPLFIIAGIIEGFITPASISLEAKYAVALVTLMGLILYVWVGKMKLNASTITQRSRPKA